jgi:hypothetical protein
LAGIGCEQHRLAEPAEGVETDAGPPQFLEDGLEAIAEQALRGQHLAVLGLEQEPFLAVTDVHVHYLSERSLEVDVPVGR